MRIIAFITDYAVVDRIINHLNVTFVAERPPPPHVVSQEFFSDSEASADYFS
ncbi:MAG: acid--CoA ligase [Candidatus Aminicenantes bacterium]|nr:acid--CoA ligase [Candidatus Aminicenantes bacterium]